jgi:dolichol-phosphate mannosyltransferase
VVVPTYNESATIREVVARLFDAAGDSVELLVVDDGSPDGTAAIIKELAADRDDIHLLERSSKDGLGRAYIAGFGWAMKRDYDTLVEMDADLSHDPASVMALVRATEDADLAIGSRYIPGGRIENWGFIRRALSRLGNLYTGFLLRHGVKDSTSGFRAFRTSTLRAQDLTKVASEGYAFQIEMARRIHRSGGTIVEVPITFVERVAGKSKMSHRIVVEALLGVTAWGIKDRLSRKP